jgi:hypothetical protein
MLDLIKKKLKNKDYSVGLDYTVENNSIGVYEFWGAFFRDDEDEYITGTAYVFFSIDITEPEAELFHKNYIDFLEECQEDIEEILYDKMEGIETTDIETLGYEIEDKGIKFYIDFVAK